MKILLILLLIPSIAFGGTLTIQFQKNGADKPFMATHYDITPPVAPGGGNAIESTVGESVEFNIQSDKDYLLVIDYRKKEDLAEVIRILRVNAGL